MKATRNGGPWVIYQVTIKGQPSGINVVCEQAEWDALDGVNPGLHTLVRAGIPSEAEAEREARAAMPALQAGPRKH
jgi:hypothetical protein